ncbi:hypothetical protein EDD11_003902 [Mortierella claussenii]|nr:hypothetical protein EDD11_003902 [Mortierella claussenii]
MADMETMDQQHQPSLRDILDAIRAMPRLQAQERRVILREVVSSCDENDIQVLQRLLGQTTQSGYDLVSALPTEVSHHIFMYLDGMDLVKSRAVCRPWRRMIQNDGALWKTKLQAWNKNECLLLQDNYENKTTVSRTEAAAEAVAATTVGRNSRGSSEEIMRTGLGGGGGGSCGGGDTDQEQTATPAIAMSALDRVATRPGFMGWEAALIQELALQQNWKRGRYVCEMTATLASNIKLTLLAWPFLVFVSDWPKIYKISLDKVRRDGIRMIPIGNERYMSVLELHGQGSIACMAWDRSVSTTAATERVTAVVSMEESTSLPLVFGGFLRAVRLCDPDNKTTVTLPDVHHGFPLHVAFLQGHILSVTLDGQINLFQNQGPDYRPIRFCTVATKVLQLIPVTFESGRPRRRRSSERMYGDPDEGLHKRKQVICLAHEDGVIVKDDHLSTLCHIQLEMGSKLLHISAITDSDVDPGGGETADALEEDGEEESCTSNRSSRSFPRNELLILFEEPNTRQRRVLKVKMSRGFEAEVSRQYLTPSFSLGRGGDARDSIVMYRDRIGIVTHRSCSYDLGHYCVLRLMDLKEDCVVSTEYTPQQQMEDEKVEEEEEGKDEEKGKEERGEQEDGTQTSGARIHPVQRRGRLIHLHDFAEHKAACRILAMDHARIVLGMGSRTVKVLCLA